MDTSARFLGALLLAVSWPAIADALRPGWNRSTGIDERIDKVARVGLVGVGLLALLLLRGLTPALLATR